MEVRDSYCCQFFLLFFTRSIMINALKEKNTKVITKSFPGTMKDLKNIKVSIDVIKNKKPAAVKVKVKPETKKPVLAMRSPDLTLPMNFAREALAAL